MDPRIRSLVTLTTLGALLAVAAVWGWTALTTPFPSRERAPLCVDRTYDEGERLARGDVTVSVLNAGTRNGLAGLTMNLFEEAGFAGGQSGNAPDDAKVKVAEIWTSDRKNPAVKLVRSHLGKRARIVEREPSTVGVQVVVGDGFQDLAGGRRAVPVKSATTVCGPP